MTQRPDYAYLDRIGARNVFFPRPDHGRSPPGSMDVEFNVAPGVMVAGRLYTDRPACATVLYFHGNGEVVCDHDGIAPMYHAIGLNLLVAEFRGYGHSGGQPSLASVISDCPPIVARFHQLLDELGYDKRRFVMGRSLGSHPALEIAANHATGFEGLIIESGAASLYRMLERIGATQDERGQAVAAAHDEKLGRITLPTLIIHGAEDELVPVTQALRLQELLGDVCKRLLLISGAGHNDLLWVGRDAYFQAIDQFIGAPAERS